MHCLYGGYNLHRFSDALGLAKPGIQLILILLNLMVNQVILTEMNYKLY